VDQPIQIKETFLPPGSYTLKLLNSNSDRHIVQIYNRDQSHIIDTVLAVPNYRLQPTGKSQFLFWETPPGKAKALRAWFYPGDNFGQEFPYPKHLRELEVASAAISTPVPQPSTSQFSEQYSTSHAEQAPITQPAETQPSETQAATPEPQRPVEMAENTPPQTPAAEPAPQNPPPSQTQPLPERLPKTGSPYPMIGLAGLVSLALYSLLRLKIWA
jgi:hypothetical protein